MVSINFLTCSNKGCFAQGYHKLDLDTDEVICEECGKSVDISPYMKKTLKSTGQTFKRVKNTQEKLCKACGVISPPILLEYGRDVFEVVCRYCGNLNQHLTSFFTQALKLDPSIERIPVVLMKTDDEMHLIKTDGEPLPWNDPNAEPPPKKLPTEEELRAVKIVAEKKKNREWVDKKIAEEKMQQPQQLEQITQPTTQPTKGAAIREKPASAQDMLNRANVEYTGHLEHPDDNIRKPFKRPEVVEGPQSAQSMLNRAGYNLAVPQEENDG